MKPPGQISSLGFSQYELAAYLALVDKHPVNGSQLSRRSGIPRARIYDVLLSLKKKGWAVETENGLYVPLPAAEMSKRLRHRFETDLSDFEKRLRSASDTSGNAFIWTIRGYDQIIDKAREMIASARTEIYVRFFPEEGRILDEALSVAASKGVIVKYVSMGNPATIFEYQVIHGEAEKIERILGGRTIDLVVDKKETLVGMVTTRHGGDSCVNWTKNHFVVVSNRDSLRHDFSHYFLYKVYEKKQNLTKKEKRLYALIKNDWSWEKYD